MARPSSSAALPFAPRRAGRRCGRRSPTARSTSSSSGHSPATVELKFAGDGDFGKAWGGISGLEVSLPAVWTAASARGHSLADVVRWMSSTPADWLGLTSKGAIRIGADADLVAFAPDDERVIDAAELQHRVRVSAFDGQVLHGAARATWVGGVQVHGEGAEPIAEGGSPVGKLLTRPWRAAPDYPPLD